MEEVTYTGGVRNLSLERLLQRRAASRFVLLTPSPFQPASQSKVNSGIEFEKRFAKKKKKFLGNFWRERRGNSSAPTEEEEEEED